MVGGSRAYNLATELSDIDYVGVYSFDTSTVLSMSKPARVPSAPLSTLPNSDGPDVTLYEVKQYLLQLCKGASPSPRPTYACVHCGHFFRQPILHGDAVYG
jgi:predicted nucleotidyltransferase